MQARAIVLVLLGLLCGAWALEKPSQPSDAGHDVANYRLEHQIGEEGQWTTRGRISILLGPGKPTVSVEAGSLSAEDVQKLKPLLSSGGLYRIRVVPEGNGVREQYPMAYLPICSLAYAGFKDAVTLHVDPYGTVLSLGYSTPSGPSHHPLSPCPEVLSHIQQARAPISFHTSAKLAVPRPAERPHDVRTLKQQEDEMAAGAQGGEQQKSFLQKYWMYILPLGIFFFLQMLTVPVEGQQSGSGAGARRS